MIGTAETLVKWLFNQDRAKLFEVKAHTEKRTLTQNAYMWSLINEIANKMNYTVNWVNKLHGYALNRLRKFENNHR